MKNEDDILNKAVKAMKQEQIPVGPSENLAEETLERLNHVSSQLPQQQFDKQVVFSQRLKLINSLTRIAAVIILLVSVGYAAGRLSAPKAPDMQQIQAALEPAIREELLDEVTQYVQLGVTSGYIQLREELTEQYQQDLNQAALQILNASNTITNQRLEELIQYIATAQLQDRQWLAAAIRRTEQNRLEDKTQLGSALINFASRTELDLQQTQQNVAVIAGYLTGADQYLTDENESPNDLN